MDNDYPLDVRNTTSYSISAYLNQDGQFDAVYPDTTLMSPPAGIQEISAGEKISIAGGSLPWKRIFDTSVPTDTLSLIIIHFDTLSSLPWDEIRTEYKILKRYDLSLADLERINFTIVYPPDESMEGIKMFPPE